ncbi:MAG: class I SAM-dependent methyltransferase [Candidatus Magasanikbacteria bacterium]|nr:class I SAM-dependent methyltransferase [Candidatus Magasanikbacteria bacterium]NCS72444.1 class I SAM-dependent methyltransferase [Candidatus Magasanikbacteria bacterium]
MPKRKEYYTQSRQEMLKYIPKTTATVLELGCGAGAFCVLIKDKTNAEIWGIDRHKPSLEEAQKFLHKTIHGDVVESIATLPNNYFDCIVCNDILEHLEDPYTVIRTLKNKLTNKGRIVCSLPNVRYLPNIFNFMVKKQWKYEDEGVLDSTHLRFFTQKSIADMFEQHGYSVHTLEGINPLNSWKFTLINILTFGFLSDTTYIQFACVAEPKHNT